MVRNLMVTGIVSVVMGITTLALRSSAPAVAEPEMDEQPASSRVEVEEGEQRLPRSPMDPPQAQDSLAGGQTGQLSAAPSASKSMTGGMAGGGQAAGGMMMCPCMQMMMQMMGSGSGGGMMGGQMNPAGAAAQPLSNPRTKEQARERAQQYLETLGNPNLKLGEVNETAASYEIEILTRDDSLVNRLILDKQTGALTSQY